MGVRGVGGGIGVIRGVSPFIVGRRVVKLCGVCWGVGVVWYIEGTEVWWR